MATDIPIPPTRVGTNYGGAAHIPPRQSFAQDETVVLPKGCYELSIVPYDPPDSYEWSLGGSLRIEHADDGFVASGDTYLHLDAKTEELGLLPEQYGEWPSMLQIPIRTRMQYAYYVSVTQLVDRLKEEDFVRLGFDLLRITEQTLWYDEDSLGPYWADLEPAPVPSDAPDGAVSYGGVLYDGKGLAFADIHLHWVSSYLRRANIDIQRAPGVPAMTSPTVGEAPLDITKVFESVDWQVETSDHEISVATPESGDWDLDELHRTMMGWRSEWDVDRTWTYNLLIVPEIFGVDRGIMFDYASDPNAVPREGAALESNAFTGAADTELGELSQAKRDEAYFRVAIHELGHTMGLDHNFEDNGFMNTTGDILADGGWDGVSWGFHEDDAWRLRHWPDPLVRPGGIPWSGASLFDLADGGGLEGLTIAVRNVQELPGFPLGAPVRLEVTLNNESGRDIEAPPGEDEYELPIRGRVIGPDGIARSFGPANRCREGLPTQRLPNGEQRKGSVVLFDGRDGVLFPVAGRYIVDLAMQVRAGSVFTLAATHVVIVKQPTNEETLRRSKALLREPQFRAFLKVGGQGFPRALRLLNETIESNGELTPHYRAVEADRRARFGSSDTDGDPTQTMDGEIIATGVERENVRRRFVRRTNPQPNN